MALLIAAFAFLTTTIIVYILVIGPQEEQRAIRERLNRFAGPGKDYSERERELAVSLAARLMRPVAEELALLMGRFTPRSMRDDIKVKIARAGNPGNMQVSDYLAFKGLLMIALPLATFLLLIGRSFSSALLLSLMMLGLGSIIPDLMLASATRKRQKAITKALPDVLDLLTVSVEAGLAFDSAIAKVVEKMSGPLADECQYTLQDIRVGKPRRDALKDLGERNGVPDLEHFVSSLIQADTLGVSISKVLRIQSEQMRQRRKQRAEESAMKAPVKLIFPMVFFIFPTLFVILLGPAALKMIDTFAGMGK